MSAVAELAETLAREGVAIETGAGGVPCAFPDDEAGVARVLARASEAGRRVVPIGLGAHLGALRPDAPDADLRLSTARLRTIVAYEPGDGTLTARAGCTMAELADVVRRGGHRLTPDVAAPERTTLGGAIAGAIAGRDRERYGPVRHHVLGLRVVLADGTVAKSGGRLVKNVTGFELHRLHCGARGTLGVIVEASLRLFPEPEEERAIVASAADLDAALACAEGLRAARVAPLATLVEDHLEPARARVHVLLAGRRRQVAHDAERARAILDAARARGGGEGSSRGIGGDASSRARELEDAAARAHRRALFDLGAPGPSAAALRVSAQPSAAADALRAARNALAALGIGATFVVQPAVATIDVLLAESARADALVPLARALAPELARIRARLAPLHAPRAVHEALAPARERDLSLAWMERVRAALDPRGTLASPLFPSRP